MNNLLKIKAMKLIKFGISVSGAYAELQGDIEMKHFSKVSDTSKASNDAINTTTSYTASANNVTAGSSDNNAYGKGAVFLLATNVCILFAYNKSSS